MNILAKSLIALVFMMFGLAGAAAMTCDQIKTEIQTLEQTLTSEKKALANCTSHP